MLHTEIIKSCELIMKKHSASFYEAFRFLPSPRKEAVFVIYAFCRLIDDAVDEPDASPFTLKELEYHFSHLESAKGHFIWPALRWLLSEFPLSKKPFYKQMEGQRLDFKQTHYVTLDQLEDYCEKVAGSVGEMLLPILHQHPNEEIEEAGIYLGKAMQIINIIRDVGEDQLRGRRYIPKEMMDHYAYSEEQFEQKQVTVEFVAMINNLEVLADNWLEKGLEQIDSYPGDSGFCVKLAANYYRAILDSIKKNQYDVFNKRAYVTHEQRAGLLLRTVELGISEYKVAAGDL